MPPKKEDKLKIKQFRDGSSNFWLNSKHYHLNKNGEIEFIAGGIPTEEEIQFLKDFCKRNHKIFKEREPSIFENEPKEYKAVFTFGKHINKSVEEVKAIDKRWLTWCRDNYSFSSAQKELKEQIIEILKIK